MAVRLYVVPGHGQGDPGAMGGGYSEADLVRRLAARIAELGGDEVETSDFSLDCYKNSGMLNWPIPPGAQVVELHMDSGGAGARGAHVIVREGCGPDAYDLALAERLGEVFPGRASAVVGRADLKNVNQAAARGVPYRLVENGFISDAGDRQRFVDRLDDIARIYLDAFGIGAGGGEGEEEMTEQDIQRIAGAVWTYAWVNPEGENTAPGGNMYNTSVCTWTAVEAMREAMLKLAEMAGADPEAIARAVSEAVERKLESISLKVEVAGE